MKKALSLVLALVMVLSLSANAFAGPGGGGDTSPSLKVLKYGITNFSSVSYYKVTDPSSTQTLAAADESDYNVKFDPADNTLVLSGVNVTNYKGHYIEYQNFDLTIVISGTNYLTGEESDHGIMPKGSEDDLTITGGVLYLKSQTAGLEVLANLTIIDCEGLHIKITGKPGEKDEAGKIYAIGIGDNDDARPNILVSNSNLTIQCDESNEHQNGVYLFQTVPTLINVTAKFGPNYDGTGAVPVESDSDLHVNGLRYFGVRIYTEPNEYIIEFDPNEGSGSMDPCECEYDTTTNLPVHTFTREGYKFKGWATSTDTDSIVYEDEQEVINVCKEDEESITLYAVWEPIEYTIEFDANGGEGTMDDVGCIYDSETDLPANEFTKEGYHFIGWATESDAEEPEFDDEDTVENLASEDGAEVTLYAIWEPNEYTVEFDPNGGEGTMDDVGCIYDSETDLPANEFTKEGYHFVGWSTDSDAEEPEFEDEDTVENLTSEDDGEVTLYAVWAPNVYTIRFDANGGEGTMADLECEYDEDVSLTANEFTKDGYAFKGWATSTDTDTAAFADRASVKNLSSEDEATVTLYAVWEEESECPRRRPIPRPVRNSDPTVIHIARTADKEEDNPETGAPVMAGIVPMMLVSLAAIAFGKRK